MSDLNDLSDLVAESAGRNEDRQQALIDACRTVLNLAGDGRKYREENISIRKYGEQFTVTIYGPYTSAPVGGNPAICVDFGKVLRFHGEAYNIEKEMLNRAQILAAVTAVLKAAERLRKKGRHVDAVNLKGELGLRITLEEAQRWEEILKNL